MKLKNMRSLLLFLSSLINYQAVIATEETKLNNFLLQSSAFSNQNNIPRQYTCEGDNISPALSWSGIPKHTKSLVLIVDDPDAPDPAAPKMTWVHWLLYNIPATVSELPKALNKKTLPPGTQEGKNDWRRTGYGGPCPPIGRHRYFFKLYALDVVIPDLSNPEKKPLLNAIRNHIIAQAVFIGTYQKTK